MRLVVDLIDRFGLTPSNVHVAVSELLWCKIYGPLIKSNIGANMNIAQRDIGTCVLVLAAKTRKTSMS